MCCRWELCGASILFYHQFADRRKESQEKARATDGARSGNKQPPFPLGPFRVDAILHKSHRPDASNAR